MQELVSLFEKCLTAEYIHVEESADYYVEKIDHIIYIYLQCSNGIEDWINNFDFPITPYKRMGMNSWFCHRGFLRVWRAIEPYIKKELEEHEYSGVTIVGYSHGGGIAVLCHEYIWFNFPNLRDSLYGYGFGAPRVIWGLRKRSFLKRWRNFLLVRNVNDIVTFVPPAILGYYHVGKILEIGERGKYTSIDAHRPENILTELKKA